MTKEEIMKQLLELPTSIFEAFIEHRLGPDVVKTILEALHKTKAN